MEWTQLWAGITFAAQNGDAEGLLTAAAAGGLHLSDIVPRPGGFSARCAAWHYRKLAALARRRRVRLRIQKRQGLFFCIRPLLRRRGLWAGCFVFLPLLLWLQGFVWFVEPVGLTPGQQARAAVVLWEAGLFPGNAVTQEKLAAGEYALLQSGEFSWASLNFMKGKLVAEAAAAKPVPDIAAGTLHGLRARVSGTVVRTNLVSGTMLVVPGQAVEAGQGLIGTARAERDGTLIFQPAAGSVRAQFEWENEQDTALMLPIEQLTRFSDCTMMLEGVINSIIRLRNTLSEGASDKGSSASNNSSFASDNSSSESENRSLDAETEAMLREELSDCLSEARERLSSFLEIQRSDYSREMTQARNRILHKLEQIDDEELQRLRLPLILRA